MSHPLFRREVLQAKRVNWLGGIALSQPLRAWVLALAACVAALSVALFLFFGTYTRRSTVVGRLVPSRGLATLPAPASGILARIDVVEGERVSTGQTLAVVTVPHVTPAAGDTLAALERRLQRRQEGLESASTARRQLLVAQAEGASAQLSSARRALAQFSAAIATRQVQVGIARSALARLRQLQKDKYVSELQADQQEDAVLEQEAAVQDLQRQATAARVTIAQLEQSLHEIPGQRLASDAEFQGALAQLEQERLETQARGELAITAPVAGVVATEVVKPGQAVEAGQPLMSLLPGDGRLEAELFVPSRAIGFISPGDRVLLRYQAYPYQKFGHALGTVARISRSALGNGELALLLGGAQPSEPFYRITVSLARQDVTAYGKPEALKPGMLLEADILGETRRLAEWLLEPLYSLSGKVVGD